MTRTPSKVCETLSIEWLQAMTW